MPRSTISSLKLLLLVALTASQVAAAKHGTHAAEPPAVVWTSSRLHGSPDPPLPLVITPAFPGLTFNEPMQVRWQPDLRRYFVCELRGKVWSFPHDEQATAADLAIDLTQELTSFDPERSGGVQEVYSLVFDPDFATNRFVYLCLILSSKTGSPLPDGSRISRFRVTEDSPPRIDPASELPVFSWLSGGHNGCDLAFDASGCLLISTGDGSSPSPPDALRTGQDISDVLGAVLRIDVRGATPAEPYRIPTDNPFVGQPAARPEVWAYGFRNPWRISCDLVSGLVHAGDVGWEKWELIHEVISGGNYGWSIREGHELIDVSQPQGPTPILPPRVALPHTQAASITGGFVYRGPLLTAINGEYLFGDWVTGRIWAVPTDRDRPHHEVAAGPVRVVAFAADRDGEPLVVSHHDATCLFRLTARTDGPNGDAHAEFPRRLSETGLFADTTRHTWSPGVRSFAIAHAAWHDGATADRAIGLPDGHPLIAYPSPQPLEHLAMFSARLHFPPGTALAKTLELAGRRLETQVLHFDGQQWRGYAYVWNAEQNDALLAPEEGMEIVLPGREGRRWRVHGRGECLQCHNPWSETTLAFTPEQLHSAPNAPRETLSSRTIGNDTPHGPSTWQHLAAEGLVEIRTPDGASVDPADCVRHAISHRADDPVELRARSWLEVNCRHCHQFGAGTAVSLSLRLADDHATMRAIDVVPEKGSFGLEDARIISPGFPERSTLVYRIASATVGRMPHIGSREIDSRGVSVVAEWIESLAPRGDADGPSTPAWHELAAQLLTEAPSSSPTANNACAPPPASARLSRALLLAVDLCRDAQQERPGEPRLPPPTLSALAMVDDPVVASLFEGFLPAAERQRRLGPEASFPDVAGLVGSPARGRDLFFSTTRLQCGTCHRVGREGGRIGPDLSGVGRRLPPSQLFEAIAEPDRQIAQEYATHLILRLDGTVVRGLLEEESPDTLRLRTATGELVTIPLAEVDEHTTESQSLMPSGLAAQLTAEEMADLLAWLATLTSVEPPPETQRPD